MVLFKTSHVGRHLCESNNVGQFGSNVASLWARVPRGETIQKANSYAFAIIKTSIRLVVDKRQRGAPTKPLNRSDLPVKPTCVTHGPAEGSAVTVRGTFTHLPLLEPSVRRTDANAGKTPTSLWRFIHPWQWQEGWRSAAGACYEGAPAQVLLNQNTLVEEMQSFLPGVPSQHCCHCKSVSALEHMIHGNVLGHVPRDREQWYNAQKGTNAHILLSGGEGRNLCTITA